MPRLLITGSEGKIGTILKAGLSDRFELYCVDKLAGVGERSFCADLADDQQVQMLVQQLIPLPYIVPLAAEARVDADWPSVLKNNIVATRNLYEAARVNGTKRIIFASSNHVTSDYESSSPGAERDNVSPLDHHPRFRAA